ncbi:MAG: hypothetical protein JNL82_36035 [Myxococcales bacterium]|nr:hypothetical protein [Myxococcales bacterium]
MTGVLARPAFWTEPRDPWAWQRALRRVAEIGGVPDPWPAWEGPLRELLPRRAVQGLYGWKTVPSPGTWLGTGFLSWDGQRWSIHPDARVLVDVDRKDFERALACWLVARSPWVRLLLTRLSTRAWTLPRGTAPLHAARALRVPEDLDVGVKRFRVTLPRTDSGVGHALRVDVQDRALAPLHAPLYLLHALGWLDAVGRPTLPTDLRVVLLPDAPSELLRRVSVAEADARGFVPLERAARGLWAALHGKEEPSDLAAWSDAVFGAAVARGTIEVHEWAPGQPRHGRGHLGDRDRKLVRWTIHDDFDIPGGPV